MPTHHKTCLVHTLVLDLENPLVFYAPAIREHNTVASHVSYLLLVHVGKFLEYLFSPLFARVFAGIIPSFIECLGFFRYRLGADGDHDQID